MGDLGVGRRVAVGRQSLAISLIYYYLLLVYGPDMLICGRG